MSDKIEKTEKFDDFISYVDEKESQQDIYVQIIKISQFVTFKNKSGKVISIPAHRVKKIKQKEENYNE